MIVDVHTHLWDRPDRLGPALGMSVSRRLARRPWERVNVSPDVLAQTMEAVDAAIILGFVSRRLEADIPADLVAGYVAQDPSKYVGFAGVDPTADDWRDRLAQLVELKLSGVTLSPAAQGFHPTHSRALQVYEFCVEHRLPVMIDAASYPTAQSVMEFGQPHLLDEIARDFPDLRMVIGQIGHPWTEPTLTLLGKHPHVYADISSLAERPWQLYQVLQSAHQQDVIHRLFLGSGFPFATPQQVMASLYHVNGLVRGTLMPYIPRQALKGIVQRDALACLGIEPLTGQAPRRPSLEEEGDVIDPASLAARTQASQSEGSDADQTYELAQPSEGNADGPESAAPPTPPSSSPLARKDTPATRS